MTAPLVTAWSYSRYAMYKECPFKFKCKHLDKLPEEGSAAMERGNTIHSLAENFTKGVWDPNWDAARREPIVPPELRNFAAQFIQLRELKAVVEQEWGFRRDWSHTGRPGWFGQDVWFRAKTDVHVLYDDDTLDMVDHKTGKKYQTNEDQVELFALAGFKRYPNVTEVTTRLWYLDIADHNENEVIRVYTRKDAANIQKDWEKRVKPMFNDRKFPPKPSGRCGWCSFSKMKGGPCKF